MVQLSKAFEFLNGLDSIFLQNVVVWLREMQDPTDVLLDLSHDVGQNLGPWETFRFCSLLKLTPAQPVQELGQEVLAEPFKVEEKTPAVAQAFALAHAHLHWPEVDASATSTILDHLAQFPPDGLPGSALAAAQMALCGPEGLFPDDHRFAQIMGAQMNGLEQDFHPAGLPGLFEAILLVKLAPQHLSHRKLRSALAQSQLPDGSFPSFSKQRLVRGLVTVKALALLRF